MNRPKVEQGTRGDVRLYGRLGLGELGLGELGLGRGLELRIRVMVRVEDIIIGLGVGLRLG